MCEEEDGCILCRVSRGIFVLCLCGGEEGDEEMGEGVVGFLVMKHRGWRELM